MSTTAYKGYSIKVCGISHYIQRPESADDVPQSQYALAPGYAQSMAAAKLWINADILNRSTK